MVGGPPTADEKQCSSRARDRGNRGKEWGTQSQCRAILAYKCIESNRVTKG